MEKDSMIVQFGSIHLGTYGYLFKCAVTLHRYTHSASAVGRRRAVYYGTGRKSLPHNMMMTGHAVHWGAEYTQQHMNTECVLCHSPMMSRIISIILPAAREEAGLEFRLAWQSTHQHMRPYTSNTEISNCCLPRLIRKFHSKLVFDCHIAHCVSKNIHLRHIHTLCHKARIDGNIGSGNRHHKQQQQRE